MARATLDNNNPSPPVGERQLDRRIIYVLVAGAIFFLIIFGILMMTVLSPESGRETQDPGQGQKSESTR